MSNMDKPTGAAGGNFGAPAQSTIVDLPARLRVHALAKLLDRTSREVLDTLSDLGLNARSPQSSLDREVASKVAAQLLTSHEIVQPPKPPTRETAASLAPVFAPPSPVFLPPTATESTNQALNGAVVTTGGESDDDDSADDPANRRRRRRGRRGRGRGKRENTPEQVEHESAATEVNTSSVENNDNSSSEPVETDELPAESSDSNEEKSDSNVGPRRRRRRKRKGAADTSSATDDPVNTVVHVREGRESKSELAQEEPHSLRGSTRLEAKRQRRRDGREAGRRRAPILSESEFLARRESVDRTMIVQERPGGAQIGVLEDGVLVEHFVASSNSESLVGNVYLGRVQNVLPSMEAAFVDIGKGRNAVLYAGEVNWDAAGLEGKARKIEQALSTGDSILVQVTKDPIGHKGARLTTQISLPGRFLVYVPGGGATGISRKLPDTERQRLKEILKQIVPEDAGVIIRTASEGVSEEELARDVRRLRAQWEVIDEKATQSSAKSPQLLYEEPDLLIKVIRDLFTEDFSALIVSGDDAWDTIEAYVKHVAPDLLDRLKRHVGSTDAFVEHRIDEQILKALDRKVWLPSGGTLVIDRTEAMTVIDVNTGKFTGSGGNLEETVTRNNLEAAEEIVRQLRLRDIGGIIVIDFIDMVLESNRDLVVRRLTECLGRDRTRHQVAEVTSLGLVQMTRKRVGTGLLEAFSTTCEHCRGRGVVVSTTPVHAHNAAPTSGGADAPQSSPATNGSSTTNRRNRHRNGGDHQTKQASQPVEPTAQVAAPTMKQDPAVLPVETESTAVVNGHNNGAVYAGQPTKSNGRRRSRRAASRPAGPPVQAGQE